MLASEVVPYVVLPGGTFRDQTGLAFGDVVMVIFGGVYTRRGFRSMCKSRRLESQRDRCKIVI